MTHEVQTPLNAIIGYLELLEMDVSGALADTQRTYVQRAQESSRHLLRLVRDVLDFSKSETARLAVEHEEVDAAETARGALALVRPLASGRLLVLVDETDSAAGLRFVGDEYRVRQILVNLLTNAIKFTPPGGRIEIGAQPEDGVVRIVVADTGRGIPAEKLEAVFDPFVQVDRRGTLAEVSQQGVGLGLAISRELARAMGGELTAESTVGAGSTFILSLSRVRD
jgi:signal transduction histidine kinase